MVGATGGEDFIGAVYTAAEAGLADHSRGRRNDREAQRGQAQSQGLLPRCGALDQETGGQMLWIEMDQSDAVGPVPWSKRV